MTTEPFIALVDMDAPLVQWEEGLVSLARTLHPHIHTPDAGTRYDWDLLVGLAAHERDAIINVMHYPGFYRGLQPVEGAKQALYEMLEEGIEVILCSTPSLDNPTCASDKLAFLDEHFGREIAKRTILTQDKTLVRGDILIDDKPTIKGLMAPTWKHVIFDRAYNLGVPGPRLVDWANWRVDTGYALMKELAA